MKLEDQVCNLEHAIKLKRLGINQSSQLYWEDEFAPQLWWSRTILKEGISKNVKLYSAFTVSEILKKIPKVIDSEDIDKISYLKIFTDEGVEWCVQHSGVDICHYYDNSDDPNLANVLAGMLISLIEMGIVNPGKGR